MKKRIIIAVFIYTLFSNMRAMEMGEPPEKGKGEETSPGKESIEKKARKILSLKELNINKIAAMIQNGEITFGAVMESDIPEHLKMLIASKNYLTAGQFILDETVSLKSKIELALINDFAAITFILSGNIPIEEKTKLAEKSAYAAIEFAKQNKINKNIAKIIAKELLKSPVFDISVLDWEGFRNTDPYGNINGELLAQALTDEYINVEFPLMDYASLEPGAQMMLISVNPLSELDLGLTAMVIEWALKKIKMALFTARIDPTDTDAIKGPEYVKQGKFYYLFSKQISFNEVEQLKKDIEKIRALAIKRMPILYNLKIKKVLDELMYCAQALADLKRRKYY